MKLYNNGIIIPFNYNCLEGYDELKKYTFDESKFIRLMTDYEAYSIWSFDHCNMSYDEIPNITIETIISLEALRKTFDSSDYETDDSDLDALLIELLEISFILLIKDFPDYTIWMF